jgi:hypothetical protein
MRRGGARLAGREHGDISRTSTAGGYEMSRCRDMTENRWLSLFFLFFQRLATFGGDTFDIIAIRMTIQVTYGAFGMRANTTYRVKNEKHYQKLAA